MKDIRRVDDEKDRSIRNISLVHKHKAAPADAARHPHATEDELVAMPELPHRRRRHTLHFWPLFGGVVVMAAVLGLLVSTVFAGATITVYPRVATVTLPAVLQAQLNAPVGVLAYKNLSVSRSSSVTAPAQGVNHVLRPASGVITISNTYTAASQRLIANTRFETADGKIYRIRDSVVVPGMSAGKPGTVSATVYADSPGPAYNKSGTTIFTIPGFKGDPRYAKFSAQSQGDITGGFVGDEAAVSASDLAAAKSTLQKQLDTDVRGAAASEIPEGYVAIPGTLSVTFSDITQTAAADKTATLTQNATALGSIVRQSDFATAIAHKSVQNYKGEAVLFGDTSHMDASAASTSKPESGTITIALVGTAQLIWQFDAQAIKAALVGKDKAQFEATIKAFSPAVAEANASIRPFWEGVFPADADKISIRVGIK